MAAHRRFRRARPARDRQSKTQHGRTCMRLCKRQANENKTTRDRGTMPCVPENRAERAPTLHARRCFCCCLVQTFLHYYTSQYLALGQQWPPTMANYCETETDGPFMSSKPSSGARATAFSRCNARKLPQTAKHQQRAGAAAQSALMSRAISWSRVT